MIISTFSLSHTLFSFKNYQKTMRKYFTRKAVHRSSSICFSSPSKCWQSATKTYFIIICTSNAMDDCMVKRQTAGERNVTLTNKQISRISNEFYSAEKLAFSLWFYGIHHNTKHEQIAYLYCWCAVYIKNHVTSSLLIKQNKRCILRQFDVPYGYVYIFREDFFRYF